MIKKLQKRHSNAKTSARSFSKRNISQSQKSTRKRNFGMPLANPNLNSKRSISPSTRKKDPNATMITETSAITIKNASITKDRKKSNGKSHAIVI